MAMAKHTPVPHHRVLLLRSVVAATVATTLNIGTMAHAALPAGAVTQLPDRPDLRLSWLKSVSLSRQQVVVGQEITGTIVLKRPAFGNMEVAVRLEGARDNEGVQTAQGAVLYGYGATVRPGEDRATFRISTFQPQDGSKDPRSFVLTISLGQETLRTGFTVLLVPLK
jgi:hypothetical protein